MDGNIHDVAGPGLLDEFWKLNGCDIGECKVTLGNNLPANHVLHIVVVEIKNANKLKDCNKSCYRRILLSV